MVAVFERFSDQARRAVVGAQEEARLLGHDFIGTEHLLLGILRFEDGAGARLLRLFDVPVGWARSRVRAIVEPGRGSPSGHIPFTPRAKKVLEMSLREALQLGDNFIGSEHVLLGLLREGEGIGAQVLVERGVTLAGVRGRLGDVDREQGPTDAGPEPGEIHEHGDVIHVPAEDFARLVAEVAHLRDLLRHHGIDPGEELPPPGVGNDPEPPVA